MADSAIDTDDQGESWSPPAANAAVDTSQDDNSGAAPVTAAGNAAVQDDSTGVDQAIQQQNPQAPQPGQQQVTAPSDQAPAGIDDNRLPGQDQQPNPQRIASYILADKAAPPETLEQIGKIVDPQNKMSPSDRNVVALDWVTTTKGPEAAVPILQANQRAFTGLQSVALAAATGVGNKPADLKHATDAANMAQQHLLDGSHVSFAPGPNGSITATVTGAGEDQAKSYSLDVDQFKSFVDMKQGGLWDKQMAQGGAPAVLQQIVGDQRGAPVSANADNPQSNQTPTSAGSQPTKGNTGATDDGDKGSDKSTWQSDVQDYVKSQKKEPTDDDKEASALDAQSRKIFPWISQERQRQSWIAQQQNESANRQNKIDIEKEKGTWHVNTQESKSEGMKAVANIKADATTKAAAAHYMNEAMKQAQISKREEDRRAATVFGRLVNDPNAALRTPGDVEKLAAQAGVKLNSANKFQPQQEEATSPAPAAPKAAAGPPTSAPQQALAKQVQPAPADPSQRQVGTQYRSPTGKVGTWTGKGWQVQ
jgi:hypothetical protein